MDLTPFTSQGYLLLRGLLDPERVSGLHAFLAAEAEACVAGLCQALGVAGAAALPAAIAHWSGEAHLEGLGRDLRQQLCGHFPLATRLSPHLWTIAREPRLQEVLCALLGTDRLFMHLPPTARFVLPGNLLAGVPAHQDISYNRHMTRFVTVWTPLVGIDESCGGVEICAGSGADPEQPVAAEGPFWLRGVDTGGRPMVHPHLEPGDVLVLNPWVVHASRPNRSGRIRLSVDCRFFGSDGRSDKHHLDLRTWQVVEPPAGG
jgi:hypothetical protein